jgi:hypothetical protein
MIKSFSDFSKTYELGDFDISNLYKLNTPIPQTSGYFVDLNQTGGTPKYNPFAGSELTATPLFGNGNFGIYPGQFTPNKTKYLNRMRVSFFNGGSPPTTVFLNDYLMFYPLIDCDTTDVQTMVNISSLPRYSDGEGVMAMLVVTAPMLATASMVVTYTNSKNISGRQVTFNLVPGVNIGVCATGNGQGGVISPVPFMPLASGDSGIKTIDDAQLLGGAGGFICICLVKPLATLQTFEFNCPVEKIYGFDDAGIPQIENGAHLNLMLHRNSQATTTTGLVSEFIFTNI